MIITIPSVRRLWLVGFALLGLVLTFNPSVVVQGKDLDQLRDNIQPLITDIKNVDVAPLYLDGRPIFSLAASRIDTPDSKEAPEVSPIRERVKTVRHRLQAIAQQNIKPEDIKVTLKAKAVNETSHLPIIQVNGQYLLTVTAQDAEVHGTDVDLHAESLIPAIKKGLVRYYQERQPAYLQKRALQSLGILVVTVLGILILRQIQRQLKRRRSDLLAQETDIDIVPAPITEEHPPERLEQALQLAQEQKSREDAKNRIKFRYDIFDKGLQLAMLCLGFSSLALVLSLFPQTRWFQSFILANILQKILQVLLSFFGTYTLIRLSFLATDYAFSLLRAGQLLSIHRPVRSLQRLQTLAGYVKSIFAFSLTLGGILLILSLFGLDLGPLLAGAGILGLAISFGSQSLIKDMINGLFLIWEDQFGVDDVVTINGVSGAVEMMNLRMTQLRSQDGDLITIPNGSIVLVKNHSNQWSRANLAIKIAYDTDLDHAIEVIQKTALRMTRDPKWQNAILEEPEVLGVDAFEDSGITIRLWVKTLPLKQWEVSRELRRLLKQSLDREGISFPIAQRSIWFDPPSEHHE